MDYEKYRNQQIKDLGFDPEKLNEDQKESLLLPIEAPENYYHDGEIGHDEAKVIWRRHMKNSGFTPLQILIAEKNHGL